MISERPGAGIWFNAAGAKEVCFNYMIVSRNRRTPDSLTLQALRMVYPATVYLWPLRRFTQQVTTVDKLKIKLTF